MPTLPDPPSPAPGLGGRALATLAVSVAGTAAAFAAALVLARTLGAAGYGAYAWALAVAAGLAVPATAGLDLLLVREVALLGASREWPEVRGMWARARRVVITGGLILAAVAAAAALALGDLLPVGLQEPLLIALPVVPLIAAGALQQAVAQGLHRPVAGLTAWSLARQLALLAGAAAAAIAGGLDATGAVLLASAAAVIAYVACARTLRRIVPAGDRAAAPEGWVRRGRPLAVMSSVAVVDAQLGLIALGLLESARDVGVFAAATQATVGFVLIRNAAARPLLPLLSRLHDAATREDVQAELTRATRWVAAAIAAGALVVCVLADPLLSLFGEGFDDGTTVLVLLAAGHVVNGAVAFNGMVLTATGHARSAAHAATVSVVVNAALLAVLVPRAGVEGAAAAWLAGVTVRNVLNSRAARRELGLRTGPLR